MKSSRREFLAQTIGVLLAPTAVFSQLNGNDNYIMALDIHIESLPDNILGWALEGRIDTQLRGRYGPATHLELPLWGPLRNLTIYGGVSNGSVDLKLKRTGDQYRLFNGTIDEEGNCPNFTVREVKFWGDWRPGKKTMKGSATFKGPEVNIELIPLQKSEYDKYVVKSTYADPILSGSFEGQGKKNKTFITFSGKIRKE